MVLNQPEPHRRASLMGHQHAVRARPTSKPQPLLCPGPQPTVPPGKTKRGQTDLLAQANDSPPRLLDSVSQQRCGAAMPAAAEDPAAFSIVSRAALSQQREPCFPTNIWAQAARNPCRKSYRKVGRTGCLGI